jgi:hypothetical protein
VRARSGGFHHSTGRGRENTFGGDDGTWDCDARGFEILRGRGHGPRAIDAVRERRSVFRPAPRSASARARIADDAPARVLPEPLDTHIRLGTARSPSRGHRAAPDGIFCNALDITAPAVEFTTTCT